MYELKREVEQEMSRDGGDRCERGLRSTVEEALPSGVSGVVHSRLELVKIHVQLLNTLLAQDHPGSSQRPKMRNGSLSGLDLLGGPLWSLIPLSAMCRSVIMMLPPNTMQMTVLYAAAMLMFLVTPCVDHVAGCLESVLQPENILMSVGHAAYGGCIDVSGPCCHLKPW